MIDLAGNTFGDKVDLDIIVEDDCSESVILQELMDGNGDMNMTMDAHLAKGSSRQLRDERTSMMINRNDYKPSLGSSDGSRQPNVVAN